MHADRVDDEQKLAVGFLISMHNIKDLSMHSIFDVHRIKLQGSKSTNNAVMTTRVDL